MRLNGIAPPVGTLLPGIEPLVVEESFYSDHPDWYQPRCTLRLATNHDFMNANLRAPREVHSVYEHSLIPRRMTVFGMARVIG